MGKTYSLSRKKIDLFDELVAEVTRRYHLPSMQSAVEHAFRRVDGIPSTPTDFREFSGIGWDGGLEQLRGDRIPCDPNDPSGQS